MSAVNNVFPTVQIIPRHHWYIHRNKSDQEKTKKLFVMKIVTLFLKNKIIYISTIFAGLW